jgi:hypothetical protein
MGIASFAISVLAAPCLFAILVLATLWSRPPGGLDPNSLEAMLLGFMVIGLLGAVLVGLGLGVAGLFARIKKKIFAILGTCFSFAVMAVTLIVLAIGIFAA